MLDYTIQLYEFFFGARYQILYSGLFALGITLVLLLILRLIVGPLVWLLIFLTVTVTIGATAMLWIEYRRVSGNIDDKEDAGGAASDAEKNNRDFYLAASVIASVFMVVLVFIIVAMRKRIKTAIAIFEEASRALGDMPALFLSPFMTYAWLLAFFVLWMYASLLILTMKEKDYDPATGYYKFVAPTPPTARHPSLTSVIVLSFCTILTITIAVPVAVCSETNLLHQTDPLLAQLRLGGRSG